MNRTRKLLCLPALLAVALTASPVRAADPEKSPLEKDIATILRKLDKLDSLESAVVRMGADLIKQQEEMERLRRDLARMQDDTERRQRLSDRRDETFEIRLRQLENKLEEMERIAKGRQSNYPTDPSTPSPDQMRELKERIERLEKGRFSGSFTPSETVNPTPPVSLGVVQLQNLSFGTGLINVNGVTYTLQPGEARSITLPAGTITYEVLRDSRGVHFPLQVRALPPNDRITLIMQP